MEQLSLLRAATQRLATTPVDDVPRIAGFLASTLANCSTVFTENPTKSSDATVPLHKLRTRISALLQDRSAAGRFTAAVLIKSVAEVSPPTESSIWEVWARGLIGLLNKTDPWEVKRVYATAVVRIFLLAQTSTTLQREVTTPLLPAFITACLSAVKPITSKKDKKIANISSPLLPTVLHCWIELLQAHPTTFRPFLNRINPICISLVSDPTSSAELQHLSLALLSSLQSCAPKGSAASEWQLTMSNIIRAAHDNLDLILRGVSEDWISNDVSNARQQLRHEYSREPELVKADAAGLGAWKGIYEGSHRVALLLQWAMKMLSCQASTVSIPLGQLFDLTSRLHNMTVPTNAKNVAQQRRFNQEVSKEEREELWSNLPLLHVSSLRLVCEATEILGTAVVPLATRLWEQIFAVLETERWHDTVRCQCYASLSALLDTNSFVCERIDRSQIEAVCISCCQDVALNSLKEEGHKSTSDANGRPQNGLSILYSSPPSPQNAPSALRGSTKLADAALRLLSLLLEKVPSDSLSHPARTSIDRTSILVSHPRTMFASVMNPVIPKQGQRPLPSILPFLARIADDTDLDLEAIKRPRMSTISGVPTTLTDIETGPSQQNTEWNENRTAHVDSIKIDNSFSLLPDHPFEPSPTNAAERPDAGVGRSGTPEILSVNKRGFATMNAPEADVGELSQAPVENVQHLKKIRVANDDAILERGKIRGKQNDAPSHLNGHENSLAEVIPPRVLEQPRVSDQPTPVAAETEDDSDSDIPSINPELATDEEEDEDEDDQKENE